MLFPLHSSAQESYAIKGQVIDSTRTGIEFGNLVLLSIDDSSLLKGAHIWNGEFELLGIEQPNFILNITAPGFSRTTLKKQVKLFFFSSKLAFYF